MIAINSLTYHIGDRALFKDASLHIKPKDKIGLIGLNGTGKSTLLRLINGDYESPPDVISKSTQCSIGFLDQDLLSYSSNDSILQVAMEAFAEANKLQTEINSILKLMEQKFDESLVTKLANLQERFERLDGYSLQAKAEDVLEGIGFSTADLSRPLNEFSGGWRMRVMLGKLLLEQPDLLMLDEPTNHLDLPSIKWVEQYLTTYEGAVLVVSHDRRFLDQVCSTIVEVESANLTSYPGNYSYYLEEKSQRTTIHNNTVQNQQQKIRQTERFINRFRAKSSKARQVQSKIKSLERMERLEEISDTVAPINFRFEFKQRSGRFVSTLSRITKSFEDVQVFEDTSIKVERGDKIALIGANGKGKSTLLRIMAGTEPAEGSSELGYNVNMAFYAQHQLEALNTNHEILEELKLAGSGRTEQELRNTLGCFLFHDEDVYKKIKVLSGGEKSRVALAKTLISEANFLLLDEPTNHLDMQSVQILIQALNQYQGSFVIVSHDRHFISQVANKIWYIENKEVKSYPGNYREYDYWKSKQVPGPVKVKTGHKPVPHKSTKPKRTAANDNQLGKMKKQLAHLEDKITRLEKEQQVVEAQLSDPSIYGDPKLLQQTTEAYQSLEHQLTAHTNQWDELASKIDSHPIRK